MQRNDEIQCSSEQHENLDLLSSQDCLSLFYSLAPASPASPDSDLISFEAIEVHKNQILQTLIQELQPLLQSVRLPFKKIVNKSTFTKHIGQCSICQECIPKNFRTPKLHCKHVFHYSCLRKWYQKNSSCPLCRKQIES